MGCVLKQTMPRDSQHKREVSREGYHILAIDCQNYGIYLFIFLLFFFKRRFVKVYSFKFWHLKFKIRQVIFHMPSEMWQKFISKGQTAVVINSYLIGHYNHSVKITASFCTSLMLCLCMKGNNRFLSKFSWKISVSVRVFARNLQ